MQLIITVDTEGDDQWSEERRTNITTENAKYLPRFQELCEKYSYKPTYLVNYEMALDKNFVEFGKEHTKRGTCEIGSHPHAWNSPPDYNLTGNDIKYAPYLMEYPEEIIYEKVKFLTELLGSTFETNIVSHRAGRWGFNEAYARILEQLDYKVDCSVTPFVSWQSFIGAPNKSGGPDFRDFPTHAYFLDTSDISKPGSSSVLEIPMTVRINYSSILSSIYSIMPFPMAKRAMRGVFGPQVNQFRCIKRNTKSILKMLESEIASNAEYLEFMVHSSELMPGCSPSFPTENAIEKLYGDLNRIFSLLSERGVVGATCAAYYKTFLKAEA